MYKNSIRSEKLIKNAVIDLLGEKKDINKISVSETVKRAGVNRGTFYNHYRDVKDVLSQIEAEMMSSLLEKWRASFLKEGPRFDGFIDDLVASFVENESLFTKLVSSVPDYVFVDLKVKIYNVFLNIPDHDALSREEKALIMFLSNGISGAFLDYFLGKSDFSLQEIGQYAIALMHKIDLSQSLKKQL